VSIPLFEIFEDTDATHGIQFNCDIHGYNIGYDWYGIKELVIIG